MAQPIISLKNAGVTYDAGKPIEYKALKDVSINIYPEEYIIFFGPSGCGKSTLLYVIAGLLQLTDGEAKVQEYDLRKLQVDEAVEYHRNAIGMVFQAYYLIPSISVRANVALPLIFVRRLKKDRITRAEELLERFGILQQKGKYPTQLSGGQQQRVAVARSLANDPPIILADEPVGNLDTKSADSVLRLFQELNEKDKKTIIMVTHNPEHLHYAHRVFYMSDGKVIREVRNPKTQIREEELKPLAKHGLDEIARLFPNLSEPALKAKMVGLYVLGEFDATLEDRIEKVISAFIHGEMTRHVFIETLTTSLREGGIGLYRSHVEHIADELTTIVRMSRYLKEHFGDFPRNYAAYEETLDELASYLTKAARMHPNPEQADRFKKAIKGRLEGSLDKNSFEQTLDRSFTNGGVGFNVRTARNITRRLELLLLEYPKDIVSDLTVEDIARKFLPALPWPLADHAQERVHAMPPAPRFRAMPAAPRFRQITSAPPYIRTR